MAMARAWTQAEQLRLLEEYASGTVIREIAGRLDRSPESIKNRLQWMRRRGEQVPHRRAPLVPADRWSDELDERLISGYRAGLTLLEIAGDLSRPPGAVASRVEVLRGRGVSLAPRKPRWTEEHRQALARRRFVEGASLRQLEREFERTRGTITSQLRRLRALGYDRSA